MRKHSQCRALIHTPLLVFTLFCFNIFIKIIAPYELKVFFSTNQGYHVIQLHLKKFYLRFTNYIL